MTLIVMSFEHHFLVNGNIENIYSSEGESIFYADQFQKEEPLTTDSYIVNGYRFN